ncbi:patj homolog [Galendromus occidentalis]|uniref:Patj homolog n=1 Tax=Galendromus occidentalis TaxID=34638 RepID=A0AAJ7SDB5_9ACAR|nr:patj homolog [Galendromus occidentalis]
MMLPLLNDTADSSECLKKLSRQLARGHPAQKDIELLLTVLEDPLLRTVLQIKNSLDDLKVLVHKHPSILPRDFDILRDGTLEYRCDDDTNPTTSQAAASNAVPASGAVSHQGGDEGSGSGFGERFLAVDLMKAADGDLGITVGIVNGEDGDVHFYIKQIHPDSVAQKDGRLSEGDKVVAINGNRLSGVSYRDVVLLLQEASGLVSLLVDRQRNLLLGGGGVYQTADNLVWTSEGHYSHPQPQNAGEFVPEMVLNTEWAQVEAIELVNDGTGLGFGIIGGRSTGVVVKTILPGGVADRDGRLLSGDHILQIGDVNLRGMGSEQVAAVLRQAGTNVRLVVARPVDASVAAGVEDLAAPVVPTRILADADEVERRLSMFSNKNNGPEDNSVPTSTITGTENVTAIEHSTNSAAALASTTLSLSASSGAALSLGHSPAQNSTSQSGKLNQEDVSHEMQKELLSLMGLDQLPEMETFEVELVKDQQGLGITIAGYVCEKGKDEEISGVFVKSIAKGSAADLSRKIRVNDQVIEVDGRPLQGYSNHQAVELLRSTGKVVKLRLARYLRGARYDQLQQAIQAESGVGAGVASPLDFVPSTGTATNATTNLNIQSTAAIANLDNLIHGVAETEQEKIQKWQNVFGDDYIIAVAQLCKFHEGGGLGISLEGTVDVNEQGEEVRPHHYIRSILPDGPVGLNGVLRSGDELVEVNGRQLLGLDHRDVVNTLKDLPLNVEMVCARAKSSLTAISMSSHAHSSKAKSDTSLNRYSSEDEEAGAIGGASSGRADGVAAGLAKLKLRSRSLEPLSGLAMWSNEPQIIELIKAERGLGFSILDYQDPMNPNETVIVIRSLVPGGVAQQDGRLIPGDRLLFVNDVLLENASLDTAVQALKGAAKGPVRIGVAKPLPLPCPHEGNSSQQNPHPNSPTLAALVKSESF